MLGSGRPFLVEIQNARQVPSKALVKEIETKINNLENKLVILLLNSCLSFLSFNFPTELKRKKFCMQVGVKNLKVVDSDGWTLMHEGEAEKQVFCF